MSLGQHESLPPFVSPGARLLVYQDVHDAFGGVSVARLVFESCDGRLSLRKGTSSAPQIDDIAFDVGSKILCHVCPEMLHCNRFQYSEARL